MIHPRESVTGQTRVDAFIHHHGIVDDHAERYGQPGQGQQVQCVPHQQQRDPTQKQASGDAAQNHDRGFHLAKENQQKHKDDDDAPSRLDLQFAQLFADGFGGIAFEAEFESVRKLGTDQFHLFTDALRQDQGIGAGFFDHGDGEGAISVDARHIPRRHGAAFHRGELTKTDGSIAVRKGDGQIFDIAHIPDGRRNHQFVPPARTLGIPRRPPRQLRRYHRQDGRRSHVVPFQRQGIEVDQ